MEKKYILTDEIREFNGKILHRIQAVRDFGKIRTGDGKEKKALWREVLVRLKENS